MLDPEAFCFVLHFTEWCSVDSVVNGNTEQWRKQQTGFECDEGPFLR